MSRFPSRRSGVALGAAGVVMMAGLMPTAMAQAPAPRGTGDTLAAAVQKPSEAGTYIVQLEEPPVVAYEGGVAGLRPTKPAKGNKIDPASRDVTAYVDHLTRKQDAALRNAGGGTRLYGYRYSFNGFAAKLSATAAAKMADVPGVVAVTQDEARTIDTATTPAFLGLTDKGGLWDQLGGAASGGKITSGPGEDVIIGVVDSGIWPEHPSVSDRDANGNLVYQQIPGWHGRCMPGERFTATDCNQKLIGARYYNSGFGGNAGIDAQFPDEFNSPRDLGGHGTHTATTAGGNNGVATTGPASVFGSVSGIAPRARIAVYKSCWGGGSGSCFTTDSVAAIDQAVADGVDVLNYSISGSLTSFRDPVEIAFLFAADAGVFVAASAGNSGPAASTVAHPSPWLTTVAAGTHNRDGRGSVTLGNGATYPGASVATAVSAPLVDATAAGLPGADPSRVALCYGAADGGAVLDPAKVTGRIVVCDRGVTGRVNKSLAVQKAGGVGMILTNTSPNSINADFHFVPTVHVNSDARAAIKTYAATSGATATIAKASIVNDAPAPFTASFSSRGPLIAGAGDLLKPDLIAPGQDILAGVSPPGNSGRLFDLYSGTSMSSPHVAGLGALLTDLHPDWSPMAMKSALMTTGYDVLDGGSPAPNTNPVLIFRQGAGHVRPNGAADPGLVFDAGFDDWLSFLCAAQPGGGCAGVPAADPSDYNSPSISIGALAGTQTVTRRVTNVDDAAATYTAAASPGTGISISVSPATVTLAPGQSAEVKVTITRTTATLNTYAGGQVTWSDGSHVVRIPVVVRPVAAAVPAEVRGTGGALSYDVTFGYTGAFAVSARGLVAAKVDASTVAQDPDQTFDPAQTAGTVAIPVTVPAGTTYARFSTFDADVAPGADLDLYVYRGTTPVGSSAGGTAAEEVNFRDPVGGAYTVFVHGWGVPAGTSPFALNTWLLGSTATGTMTVTAPPSATSGTTGKIDLAFSGLAPATKYLGSVAYSGTTGLPNPTIVRIDTP